MNDFTPLVKSHPSARVRRLLASAELDVPPTGSRERALVSLSQANARAMTTNFSGIALGTTVHRLIGAVTLYGSAARPWQLVLRGSMVGAAAGAMALATIATLRWTESPTTAAEAPALARPRDVGDEANLLRQAEFELDAGHCASALGHLQSLQQRYPETSARPHAVLLRVKALIRLGRVSEARVVAGPLLSAAPRADTAELRSLIEAQRESLPAASAR